MFYWSFPSLVHFWPPQFLILVTPVWPFGRKFRELVFTSRKITWGSVFKHTNKQCLVSIVSQIQK